MSKRVIACVPAVSAGLLATVMALSTDPAAFAADDCLARPTRPPAQGGHWRQRVDGVTGRKCWYLAEPETRMPNADATEPQPSPDAVRQQTFAAFFSSLKASFSTANTTGTQPVTQNSDARSQTTQPDEPKNNEALRGKRSRIAGHANSEAALSSKQHRQSPAQAPVERADNPPPLNEAERDALFQNFLRWKEHQTP